MGVDAGADRRASQGYLGQGLLRPLHPLNAVPGLSGITQEFLAEAHRRGVLQMSAAGLDYRPELLGLLFELTSQVLQTRNQVLLDRQQGGQVDRGGDDVVGRLPHVDVVVGVYQPRAKVAAQQLAGPVGDDLVGVGVGGSAGAGLENVQHEVPVQLPVDDLLGGCDDGVADAFVQQAQRHVAARRRLLDQSQGADEGAGEAQPADGKVQHGAHGRGAVKRVCGHLHFAHGIAFDSYVGARGHGGESSKQILA